MSTGQTPGRRYCLITPCRDEAKYARVTLDSILNQTIKPALWVIVDDGSKDETPQILDFGTAALEVRLVRLSKREQTRPRIVRVDRASVERRTTCAIRAHDATVRDF